MIVLYKQCFRNDVERKVFLVILTELNCICIMLNWFVVVKVLARRFVFCALIFHIVKTKFIKKKPKNYES